MISALGKARPFCESSRPLMWSPWKWLEMTAVTRVGSMPAAAMLAAIWPEVGFIATPVPVSNTTSPPGVCTKVMVKGTVSVSAGMKFAARTAWTSASGALRTKPSTGRRKKPSCTVVTVRPPTLKR
jgi:hypothetical protein